ncbi:hypothetical protein Tco_0564645 [Tanacetum coccineum]
MYENMSLTRFRAFEFHALWCYNIGKTCCGVEVCHLDKRNPRCLEDWENLNFQDLVVDGECFQVEVANLEIQEVVERHVVVEMDLKGPVANCSSLTHKGYFVTFVVEEVLELDVDELMVVGYLTLILAVFLLKFGELVLDELVMAMNYNEVGKVKLLRVFEMIEHDGRACIYEAFVSVHINAILTNDEFPILDVGRKIILEDNGRI